MRAVALVLLMLGIPNLARTQSEPDQGDWRAARRNLTEDYRRLFGGEPGRLRGLGVKSDSDSTSGAARADFDDLQLLQRQAREPSGPGVQPQ